MQVDQQSDSRKIFAHVETGLDPDTLHTYESLSDVLGKPIQQNRAAVYSATRRLEKVHNRTLVCVTGQGYRVARAAESQDIATVRVGRAAKQVRRGLHTAVHTEVAELTQEERRQLDQTRAGMLALQRQMTQVRRQMHVHEETLGSHGEYISSHDQRLARLELELAELRGDQRLAA